MENRVKTRAGEIEILGLSGHLPLERKIKSFLSFDGCGDNQARIKTELHTWFTPLHSSSLHFYLPRLAVESSTTQETNPGRRELFVRTQ